MTRSFTIKDLERFSGIKAHTIRMWELRYSIVKPQRAASNHRLYSLEEVKEILQLALLTKHGYRISSAVALCPDEVALKVQALRSEEGQQEAAVIELLLDMYAMNARGFESTLDRCFFSWPDEVVLKNIVIPFLTKTNIIWRGHRLDEEHFVVTAIRRKIIVAIEALPMVESTAPKVLLYLPDQTQLDLALLYANFLLKQGGIKVFYMGNDISTANLLSYMEAVQPDYLYTYLPHKNHYPFAAVTSALKESLPHSKLVVTTYPFLMPNLTRYENIVLMEYSNAVSSLIKLSKSFNVALV